MMPAQRHLNGSHTMLVGERLPQYEGSGRVIFLSSVCLVTAFRYLSDVYFDVPAILKNA